MHRPPVENDPIQIRTRRHVSIDLPSQDADLQVTLRLLLSASEAFMACNIRLRRRSNYTVQGASLKYMYFPA